jgi:hypothetical protein
MPSPYFHKPLKNKEFQYILRKFEFILKFYLNQVLRKIAFRMAIKLQKAVGSRVPVLDVAKIELTKGLRQEKTAQALKLERVQKSSFTSLNGQQSRDMPLQASATG